MQNPNSQYMKPTPLYQYLHLNYPGTQLTQFEIKNIPISEIKDTSKILEKDHLRNNQIAACNHRQSKRPVHTTSCKKYNCELMAANSMDMQEAFEQNPLPIFNPKVIRSNNPYSRHHNSRHAEKFKSMVKEHYLPEGLKIMKEFVTRETRSISMFGSNRQHLENGKIIKYYVSL